VPGKLTLVPHEVDHIISTKHGGGTTSDNLALCCTLRNKYKGSDLASINPERGEMQRLFHPRHDQCREHFQLRDGTIIPLTSIGRVTLRLLQLNRTERVNERKLMFRVDPIF
jgi:HNH endonuclease